MRCAFKVGGKERSDPTEPGRSHAAPSAASRNVSHVHRAESALAPCAASPESVCNAAANSTRSADTRAHASTSAPGYGRAADSRGIRPPY